MIYGGDLGLIYVPRSLNKWQNELDDDEPPMIPVLPYLDIEAMYKIK